MSPEIVEDKAKRTSTFGKQSFSLAVALLVTGLSFAVVYLAGPVPVRVGLRTTSMVAPAWYLASAALPFGILLAEALIDFREYRPLLLRLAPFAMLVFLGALGSARLLIPISVSGHALVAGYFVLHQLAERRAGRTWKLVLGALVLLQCAVYKLFIWDDPTTLLMGLGLGILAWGVERLVVFITVFRRSVKRKQATE